MEIKIIETFGNAKKYLDIAKNENHELKKIWQEHMIDPFWSEIAQWAPFDQSFKQPACIKELEALTAYVSCGRKSKSNERSSYATDYL